MTDVLPGRRCCEIEPIVLAVRGFEYPAELQAILEAGGCFLERVNGLEDAAAVLAAGRARAVLVGARPFTRRDRIALRLCRLVAPETAVVVVASEATVSRLAEDPYVRGAALLHWPGDREIVRRSIAGTADRRREVAP